MVWRFIGVVCVVAVCAGVSVAGVKVPWQRRVARDVEVRHKLARENVAPTMWPQEPLSPVPVDTSRFRSAFSNLCGAMPQKRLGVYVESLLGWGAKFDVDPFLLAALVFDRSECRPRTPEREVKYGVTRIDMNMHAPHIRGGQYHYFVKHRSDWRGEVLDVGEFRFNQWKADKIRSNLYFAAAFLKVFDVQCADLDSAFHSVPHRHSISHWFYGDRVRNAGPEDRVLTVRRRILDHYSDRIPKPVGTYSGKSLVSPLDGTPRLVLDYFGNPRGKKGGTGHRGIDLDGAPGEPVRAISGGRVIFAGVDLPGAGSQTLTSQQAETFSNRAMGPGGLYVHINHRDDVGSIYMHLQSLAVATGTEVSAGQVIGTLGRSGTTHSGPHLHLEIRVGTDRVDPAVLFSKVLVNPFVQSKKNPN